MVVCGAVTRGQMLDRDLRRYWISHYGQTDKRNGSWH